MRTIPLLLASLFTIPACGGRSTLVEGAGTTSSTTTSSTTTTTSSPGVPNDAAFCHQYAHGIVLDVGVDAARNVYGLLHASSTEIGGLVYSGDLLVKYTPTGDLLSVTNLGNYGAWQMWVEADGSLVIADDSGLTRTAPDGTTIYAGKAMGTLPVAVGQNGGFVLAREEGSYAENFVTVDGWSPEGALLWSQSITTSQLPAWDLHVRVLAHDSAGDAILLGHFSETMKLGSLSATTAEEWSHFLARIDGAGTPVYLRKLRVDSNGSITAAPNQDLLIAGSLGSVTDLGAGPIAPSGAPEGIFVGRLDAAGHPLWARTVAGNPNTPIASVRADAAGNAVIAGELWSTLDFGEASLEEVGEGDVFIARYDPAGKLLDARGFGDSAEQTVYRMVVNGLGTPILAGRFQGTLDFGFGALEGPAKGMKQCNGQHCVIMDGYLCQVPFLE